MTAEDATSPRTLSPENLPALDLAYGFVLPSYQWALARFEAGNTRLQTMLAIVASVSLAMPALARLINPSLSFADGWFLSAVAVFLAAMAAGAYGRQAGTVRVLHPEKLLAPEWLTSTPNRFKHDALYWAGEHFGCNRAAIEGKWRCAGVHARPLRRRAGATLRLGAGRRRLSLAPAAANGGRRQDRRSPAPAASAAAGVSVRVVSGAIVAWSFGGRS